MDQQIRQYLEQCLLLGDQLLEAIQEEAWEQFHHLSQQRQGLVDALSHTKIEHPEDPQWRMFQKRLIEQEKTLKKAMASVLQYWEEQLKHMYQLRQAQQYYKQTKERVRILHPELKG